MSKKTRIIIIAVVCFLCFQVVCIVGYTILNGYVKNAEMRAVCQEIEAILDENEAFEEKYGELASLSLNEDHKIVDVDDDITKFPCDANFSDGTKLLLFVDFKWSTYEVVNYSE